MSEDQFSFRWGIPWLDREYVQIPTVFFREYAEAGVTRSEFLFVLHLASYKYESRKGESRPSLSRIAEEMGTTRRSVQRMRRSLEEKGLLRVTYQLGVPSIYSFEGLAQRLTEELQGGDTSVTCDTHVAPPATPMSHPPATPTSPEEQEDKKKNQQQEGPGVVSLSQDQKRGKIALMAVRVSERGAEELVRKHSLERILEVVGATDDGHGIRNAAAWVVRALERGYGGQERSATGARKGPDTSQIAGCMYRRNPQVGLCLAEDPKRVPFAWCSSCDRGRKETALVGKQEELLF